MLRGHIRNSFDNDKLYNLIKKIYNLNNNIELYIHTWNIKQNNLSWRIMEENTENITDDTIYTYFKDLGHLIKCIIIDDDKKIQLKGKLYGKIGIGRCPLLGWKNYWYGQFRVIDFINNIFENKEKKVLNLRFDILSNADNFSKANIDYFNEENIISFINKNINKIINKNIFLFDKEVKFGLDNIYFGNIKTQHLLISHFNNNMDNFLDNYKYFINQEFIVFLENNKLIYD
jgi:hypothetical protein